MSPLTPLRDLLEELFWNLSDLIPAAAEQTGGAAHPDVFSPPANSGNDSVSPHRYGEKNMQTPLLQSLRLPHNNVFVPLKAIISASPLSQGKKKLPPLTLLRSEQGSCRNTSPCTRQTEDEKWLTNVKSFNERYPNRHYCV